MIDGLLASGAAYHFTLLTSFGDFFTIPLKRLLSPIAFMEWLMGRVYCAIAMRRLFGKASSVLVSSWMGLIWPVPTISGVRPGRSAAL